MRKTVCVLVVVMATQIYQFVNFILKKEEGREKGKVNEEKESTFQSITIRMARASAF